MSPKEQDALRAVIRYLKSVLIDLENQERVNETIIIYHKVYILEAYLDKKDHE